VTPSLLVDTHLLIWMRVEPGRLTAGEREAIDGAASRFISAVTLWEIAVLQNLGRLPADGRLLEIPKHFELLPIQPAHCAEYAMLPMIHKDPFDRMLIAQARSEHLILVTRDSTIPKYGKQGCRTLDLTLD